MSDPNRARIAIKFGTSKSTAKPNSSKPKPAPASALGKRPRPWGDGEASDSDDDQHHHGRHEAITGFGASGAETESSRRKQAEKKEYIIAPQANRDWRAEIRAQRRGKNLLPEEARQAAASGLVVKEEAADDSGIKWGLTVKEKKPEEEEDGGVKKEEGGEGVKKEEDDDNVKVETTEDEKPPAPPRTADEQAMDALLGREPEDSKPVATIAPTEEDAYRRDVETAGEASTLDDYNAMPVEEFGAALLRGMGWDGKERGTMRHKQVKKRPNRLGLGAKELNEAEDLGAWNQNGGKKKSRPPRLDEYRRDEEKRKGARGGGDSYKRERERERERERDYRHRDDRYRDHDRHRDRHRDGYDRDRRR